jgi:excisionase family DNA binding protein
MVPTLASTREEGLLTVAEVAQTYHVSDETVRRWIRKGILGYVMVGPFRVRRIPRQEAEKHFNPATVAVSAKP